MDVERWRREWGSADRTDGLVLFPPAWFEDASLEREDVHLLTEGGLPADAAPFLSFGPSDNGFLRGIREAGLAPLHTDWFIEIGADGSGNPVCLDKDTGAVVYLEHDEGFHVVLINSRVDALVRCLLIYRRLVADVRQLRGDDAFLDGDWPNEVVSTAIDAIRNVDPDALARGRFWPDALELS